MDFLRTTIVAATIAVLAGCDFIREPTVLDDVEREVTVHSILLAGSDTVAVLLTTVVFESGDLIPTTSAPVVGATVRLVDQDGGVLHLEPQGVGENACAANKGLPWWPNEAPWVERLGAGCYVAAVPGGIRAGGRYELIVDLAAGARIEGAAVVPDAPTIIAPAAGTELSGAKREERFLIRWSGIGEDQHIQLTFASPDSACHIFGGWESFGTDSMTVPVPHFHCGSDEVPSRIDARLRLTAFDTVYTRYLYRSRAHDGNALRRDVASAGLSGAPGIFAGAAVAEVPVTISSQ